LNSKKDNLTQELDTKLENLFDEDTLFDENEVEPESLIRNPVKPELRVDESLNTETAKLNKKSNVSLLDNLNAILLSLDWEITDELIDNYTSEINNLKSSYGEDKYCGYFYRILENLGRYIKKHLGEAHPESVLMMQSIHKSLENIFLNSDLTEVQKKDIFYKEYNKYTKFKEKVSLKKSRKPSKKSSDSNLGTGNISEALILRLSEVLKTTIKEELEIVKKEIIETLKK